MSSSMGPRAKARSPTVTSVNAILVAFLRSFSPGGMRRQRRAVVQRDGIRGAVIALQLDLLACGIDGGDFADHRFQRWRSLGATPALKQRTAEPPFHQ